MRKTFGTIPLFAVVPGHLLVITLVLVSLSVQAADTGDAPVSYGQASHEVVAGRVWLGEFEPDDNEAVSGPAADGDDTQGVDDEGGVYDFPALTPDRKSYTTNVFVNNQGSTPATLVGWVDFDGNGRFDADEAATAIVSPGASHEKVKLAWPNLLDITTDYSGLSFARFRISTAPLSVNDADGLAIDGEVEDYALAIQPDVDRDEIPDEIDPDNDNDGIPDQVEVVGLDTDADGIPDHLDQDSDNDGLPDYVEAGDNGASPVDSDNDSVPDYLDQDSDNDGLHDGEDFSDDIDGDGIATSIEGFGDTDGDGIADAYDIDADNDLIPDAVESGAGDQPADSDNDGVSDYLDLDSDNDGVPDLYESNNPGVIDPAALDGNADGRVDDIRLFGRNGFLDAVETTPDSGVPRYPMADTDGDGVHDYLDSDADGDGLADVIEGGGQDDDQDGRVDRWADSDADGIDDSVDANLTGGGDSDGDGIENGADADSLGAVAAEGPLADDDNDGIINQRDNDRNGDGLIDESSAIANGRELLDSDGDGIADFQSPAGSEDSPSGDDETPGGTTPGGTMPNEHEVGAVSEEGVRTGLDGRAGCSLSGGRAGNLESSVVSVPLLWLMTLLSALFLNQRKRLDSIE